MDRAYINWQKLTPETYPTKSGNYLVCCANHRDPESTERDCSMTVAEWLKAGDFMTCERDTSGMEGMNATERLMYYIYNTCIKITCDGFYIKRAAYEEDAEKFPGFYEVPEQIGTYDSARVYWSELPLAPEGLDHPEDTRREDERRIRDYNEQEQLKEIEYFNDLIDNNKEIHSLYETVIRSLYDDLHKTEDPTEMNLLESIYDKDNCKIKKAVIASIVVKNKMAKILDLKDRYLDILKSKDKSSFDKFSEEFYEAIKSAEDYGLTHGYISMLVAGHFERVAISDTLDDIDFWDYYCTYIKHHSHKIVVTREAKTDDEFFIAAQILHLADTRLERLVRLLEEQAPEIIINNELALIFQNIYCAFNKRKKKSPNFDSYYAFKELEDNKS